MDTENHIKEANRQLSNRNNHKTFQTDPILQHNKMVNDTLDRLKNENLLSKKTAEGLKVIYPKTPKFYITPKIQKENNPDLSLTLKFHTLLPITFNLQEDKFHHLLRISIIL